MKSFLGWKPAFIRYTINLNQEVQHGNLEPVVARDKEISQVIDILSRRTKNNPLIIGEPGVGKSAIVEGLAQKIMRGDVPEHMKNKEILALDISALTAGAKHKGEFEQRLKDVISDIISTDNTILFIEDIHLLLNDNNTHKVKAADILKKFLDHGQLPIIGVTTNDQYRDFFDKNKSFERSFHPVVVEEPSEADAFLMLHAQRPELEKFHNVIIPDDVLTQAILLSKKYILQRSLPDKALDVIDETAANLKVKNEKGQRSSNILKKSDIQKTISDWMGINITKLTQDESEKLLMLEALIHKNFVDQQTAVTKVSEAVRRGRIGLGSASRPVASFLFLGSSGVGKTELVKTLTQILYEQPDALMQLDMSEFLEKADVAKLIGAPPGYVGYEEGGKLTEAIKKRPSSIVLMDNIEKAHPDISNILLQILEEGVVTDNKGNNVSFKNTIIIGTTTIGGELIKENILKLDPAASDKDREAVLEQLEPTIKEELLKFFKPEVLNRFDNIVSFKPLSAKDMEEISKLLIAQTAKLLKKQDFTLQITEKAVNELVKKGYDPVEGARPARKAIRDAVENPIASAIISQKFTPGDTLLVDLADNATFTVSNSAKDLLQNSKLSVPKIGDVAKFDTGFIKNEKQRIIEINKIYENLKKISSTDSITDSNEKAKFEKLKEKLLKEKAKGNPTANVILLAAESVSQSQHPASTLPSKNGVQVVSDEEFDDVKAIWEENFLNMSAMGNTLEAQIEWVKKEYESTQQIIKLFTSKSQEDRDLAMRDIVTILPVLLIGGFSQEEIIAYLKAKLAAAKSALESLSEEQEITLSVHRSKPKQQEKTMSATNPTS